MAQTSARKGVLDPQIAAKIEALEPPVIKQMREILLAAKNRADSGGLTALKTYHASKEAMGPRYNTKTGAKPPPGVRKFVVCP